MPQPRAPLHRETSLVTASCRKFSGGKWNDFADTITPEKRVELLWPGIPPVSLWAFPEDLERLALGHALIELCDPGQIPVLEMHDGDTFTLSIQPGELVGAPDRKAPPMAAERVLSAMTMFIDAGGRWDATGCFHRAAVFDSQQVEFLYKTEDIGRHNCIDRIAGWALSEGQPLAGRVLFVSARATASLVAKAARAGFAAMISRSAVTTSGIAIAREAGLSLAGFARTARFTVFTDANELFEGAWDAENASAPFRSSEDA